MPPPGAKAEARLKKKKDAKQKKILIALIPLLLLLMFWQGPGMLKAFSGGEAAPPPVIPPENTTPADPSAPPSTSIPGAPPVDPAAPVALPESDVPLPADASQLISFDRFIGKDPFKQQAIARSVSEDDEPPAGNPPGTTPGGPTTPTDPDPGSVTVTYALIDTNGDRETVGIGATFPPDDPIFRLVALNARRASIGLVTGSFSNGRETINIDVGDSLTLVSQPDGLRYKIKIVSVG